MAIVDLPSFGNEEVMPITLFGLMTLFRSAATLMLRIDSAKRENGESTTVQSRPWLGAMVRGPAGALNSAVGSSAPPGRGGPLIKGTTAMQSMPSSSSTCPVVRNTRSEISRSTPTPVPRIRPPIAATIRISRVFGVLLPKGRVAWVIRRDSVTGNDCC